MTHHEEKHEGSRDDERRDETRKRVEAASPGEPASGLERETHSTEAGAAPGGARGTHDRDRDEEPAPDEVTEADVRAETREAEHVQQTGQGIRGRSTEGREDNGSEEEIRRAAEGRDEPPS